MEATAMVRTLAVKTRKAIVKAAQHGAEKIRTVAADAAGAATQAAAGVVLGSTADALEAGRTQVAQSTPRVKKALGRTAKRTIGGRRRAVSGRKRTARRAAARRKVVRKRAAAKHRAKRRSR
jgi:hypothetical protein